MCECKQEAIGVFTYCPSCENPPNYHMQIAAPIELTSNFTLFSSPYRGNVLHNKQSNVYHLTSIVGSVEHKLLVERPWYIVFEDGNFVYADIKYLSTDDTGTFGFNKLIVYISSTNTWHIRYLSSVETKIIEIKYKYNHVHVMIEGSGDVHCTYLF